MAIASQVAPAWRRVCAGVVDAALITAGASVVIGAPVAWTRVRGSGGTDIEEALGQPMRALSGEGEAGRRRSEQLDVATRLVRLLLRDRATSGERHAQFKRRDEELEGSSPTTPTRSGRGRPRARRRLHPLAGPPGARDEMMS